MVAGEAAPLLRARVRATARVVRFQALADGCFAS